MTEVLDEERVKTGIRGFDGLVNGGIPRGNVVLVSGAAGSGKSLFCLEFIYHGARDFNEPGVYVTLEEFRDRFIYNAKKLGFVDVDALIGEGKMDVVRMEVFNLDRLVGSMEDLIDKYDARRVVLDSVSVLSAFSEKPDMVRRGILDIANMLKRNNVTALFSCGVSAASGHNFGVSVEEYVVDGVVTLFNKITDVQFVRAVGVVKMRGSSHSDFLHPVMISGEGLAVLAGAAFPDNFRV